mmetsp:Transcript_24177/g.75193  ORF Transcript_24177/g.75193 Transcript_24177/m.75193 type:complete len:463 (+) Transcript_24177:154-1542(+)
MIWEVPNPAPSMLRCMPSRQRAARHLPCPGSPTLAENLVLRLDLLLESQGGRRAVVQALLPVRQRLPNDLEDGLLEGHSLRQARLRAVIAAGRLLALGLGLGLAHHLRPLLEPKEGLDGEGLQRLEEDGDADKVEYREDCPGDLAPGRGLPHRLGHLRGVFDQELHGPGGERHDRVVEVKDVPILLGVVRARQLGVALEEVAAEEVDAEGAEEEEDHAQEGQDVARGLHHAADGGHHELEARILLELLDHPQEPHEPQDVCIAREVLLHKVDGQVLQHHGAEEEPSGEEVEAVRRGGPVLPERLDRELGEHLADVDGSKEGVHKPHPQRQRVAVHKLPDDEQEVENKHPVHDVVDDRRLLGLPDCPPDLLEGGVVPEVRVAKLHKGVPLRRPDRVLRQRAQVAERLGRDRAELPDDRLRQAAVKGQRPRRLPKLAEELQQCVLVQASLLRRHAIPRRQRREG